VSVADVLQVAVPVSVVREMLRDGVAVRLAGDGVRVRVTDFTIVADPEALELPLQELTSDRDAVGDPAVTERECEREPLRPERDSSPDRDCVAVGVGVPRDNVCVLQLQDLVDVRVCVSRLVNESDLVGDSVSVWLQLRLGAVREQDSEWVRVIELVGVAVVVGVLDGEVLHEAERLMV